MNTSSQNESRRYLITIGSSKCPKMELDELKRVEPDLQSIQTLFVNEEQNYKLVDSIRDDKSSVIRDKLTNIFSSSNLKSSDTVIVYYAGHGGYKGYDSHYLFTSDSCNDNIAGTAIKTSDLVNWLFANFSNVDPPNILLILDVCYAGQGAWEIIQLLAQDWTRVQNRSQGSGLWVIASADSRTEVLDGAFVEVLKEVMMDRQWMTTRQGEFLNPLVFKDEINKRLDKKHSSFRAEGSVFGNKEQADFIRLPGLAIHCASVIEAIARRNEVVPFLGADINLLDREFDWLWHPDKNDPPSNDELAAYLNREYFGGNSLQWFQCPICDYIPDECPIREIRRNLLTRMPLGQVSQSLLIKKGPENLNQTLRKIAEKKYNPNQLHNFFASLPKKLEEKGYSDVSILIVTTAFDSTLEHAFENANQSFDLYSYTQNQNIEKFLLKKFRFGQDRDLKKTSYPTVLKLYGPTFWVDNPDNFVITEDQYIDYLAHYGIDKTMPSHLSNKLQQNHNLFLGYNLNHWYLRVILQRITQYFPIRSNWWVLLPKLGSLDEEIWKRKGRVDIYNYSLKSYITELEKQLQKLAHN